MASENFFADRFCLCRGFNGLFTQVQQHQHKFITPQPGYGVAFTYAGFQTSRNLLQ